MIKRFAGHLEKPSSQPQYCRFKTELFHTFSQNSPLRKYYKYVNSTQIWLCSTVQKGHRDSGDSMDMSLIVIIITLWIVQRPLPETRTVEGIDMSWLYLGLGPIFSSMSLSNMESDMLYYATNTIFLENRTLYFLFKCLYLNKLCISPIQHPC